MKHLTDKLCLPAALRFCRRGAVLVALVGSFSIYASPVDLIGEAAPDFVLRSLDNGNIRISEYRSQVVVLSFRSDWCGKCDQLLPVLNDLQASHGKEELQVLAIDVDGDREDARELLEEHSLSFPLLLDEHQQVSRNYDLNRLPVTLLIDREGAVRSVHRGANAEVKQQLSTGLAALLAE